MPSVTVEKLAASTLNTLKRRAKANGRSISAEICAIREAAVVSGKGLGSALEKAGKDVGGVTLPTDRDRRTVDPAHLR
jgi:plasmid stability protein